MRRLLLLAAALALCFFGASAVGAYADETPGGSRPGDPFGGQTLEPGPVFVITPGGPTSTGLPAPADPSDVEDAIREDEARNGTPGVTPTAQASASATGTPTAGVTTPGATATDVAGTPGTTATGTSDDAGSSSGALWWVAGAGVAAAALVALVLVRRRRDRSAADSLTEHAP